MSDIKERLDKLKELIQTEEFLQGKGLSNEVNIRMFCYEADEEMIVKHFVKKLAEDSTLKCNIIEKDLYKVFLSICDDMAIIEAISDMEEADGSEELLNQLHSTINNDEFMAKMRYEPHREGDVLLLTGVGDVFPFMRMHNLLEALQPYFSDIPILVMYPGKFDGHYLKLFDKLKPNDYYRAFNIV